ncbi:MAG: exonuclease SbcCD subunit D [Acidimicrobiia bacterium]
MRILHTSDWHVGKRIGRYDRIGEYKEVIAEVVELADREDVDLVLLSGDLFDRPLPPVAALHVAFDGLVGLTADGTRPVVVVAGNHDSPELFDALAPFFEGGGIHLIGSIRPPEEGGVLDIETKAGRALVACFPFLRQGRVVDFMETAGRWYGQYAERVGKLCKAYSDHLVRAAGTGVVPLLVAHFMVTGVKIDRGADRGERELHMGQAYSADPQAIPHGPQYVAMGHIHAPQPVPGSPVPAEYAGSLLQLDFGEVGEEKRVVIVDVEPGTLATRRSVPITAGRPLVRARGRWERLAERSELREAYVDVTVETDGPDPGLADLAGQAFPYLVRVRPDYERPEAERPARAGRPWDELYQEYHEQAHAEKPSDELLTAFRQVMDEVLHASP